MFLTKEGTITGPTSIILNPVETDNFITILGNKIGHSNWDKICILGIYIKIQPNRNIWDGTTTGQNDVSEKSITQVKCTYNMNVVYDPNAPVQDPNAAPNVNVNPDAAVYDADGLVNKQVFTFNSNEAFTIYIPTPSTMSTNDPVIHKPKTWWSLVNLKDGQYTAARNQMIEDSGDEDDDGDDEDDFVSSILPNSTAKACMTAGRIFFQAGAKVSFNYTINYKVALRG